MTELRGRRVVVFGGSSGVGLATARLARDRGAVVTIVGRRRPVLERTAAELGGGAAFGVVDVTDEHQVLAYFAGSGPVDHLVVTAGTASGGVFLEQPTAQARADLDGKFWGPYYVARYGAPKLGHGGSITLFSGVYSRRPVAGQASVAAANAAIEALTRTLALELAPVRVNCVSPGLLATPLHDRVPAEQRQQMFDAVAQRLPVARVGRADDAALAVLYAMENGYLTGSVIDVDGGGLLV